MGGQGVESTETNGGMPAGRGPNHMDQLADDVDEAEDDNDQDDAAFVGKKNPLVFVSVEGFWLSSS
jgi:hypothetical protein